MMNLKLIAAVIWITVLSGWSCVSSPPDSPTITTESEEKAQYTAMGVVKAVDPENLAITIDHEAITGYMPAMEMTMTVAGKELIGSIKVNDKVEFEIERTGSKVVIIKLAKTGEAKLVDARGIFLANCAKCHGADGSGTEEGISLIEGHALHHPESDFLDQVRKGKEDKMPAFSDKLSDEEIKAVVKYVREEIQGGSTVKVPHKH